MSAPEITDLRLVLAAIAAGLAPFISMVLT